MRNNIEARKKRVQRRMRFTAFMKTNGIYVAVFLCLAIVGGLIAFLPTGSGREQAKEEPAGHSLDERLNEAAATPGAKPTARPIFPGRSEVPSAEPTFIPELTPAPSASPEPTSENKLSSPVEGKLVKPYSMDALIYSKTLRQWMTHSGADIAAPKGSEVRAVAAGSVERVYEDDMLGTTVIIDHGSFKSVYSGLKKEVPVKEGDAIPARAVIGELGDTAISECADESHLHFEIWRNGSPVDPESIVLIAKQG